MSGLAGGVAMLAGGAALIAGGSWAAVRHLSREQRRARRIAQLEEAKERGAACLLCGKRNPTIPVRRDGQTVGWACDDHPIPIPAQGTDDGLDATLRVTVLMTSGHHDDSLCLAMPAGGDRRTDLCQTAATTYVETVDYEYAVNSLGDDVSAAVLTRVCDPHLAALMVSRRYEITYQTPLGGTA